MLESQISSLLFPTTDFTPLKVRFDGIKSSGTRKRESTTFLEKIYLKE